MVKERLKILLVSNAFYPEISPRSFRATELAKEFKRQGHDVVVISKFRNHDYSDFLNEFPIILKMWAKPRFPAVPLFKLTALPVLGRVFARIISVLFEYPAIKEMFIVKRMLSREHGYDTMISFAVPYPIHWGVARARTKDHVIANTWIADCGDPFMFNRLDRFRKPFYFKHFETNFCKKCDFLVVPYNELKAKFYPQFISKIKVIPQGFDFDEVRLSFFLDTPKMPVFIFAGSIIPGKRDLSLFLDFLGSLDRDFRFIVYTNQKEWFEIHKRKLGVKLELRDYIDRLSLIHEMSKVDFLVNEDTVYDSDLNLEAVPSKLIDYSLARRPILNINTRNLDKELVLEFLNKDYSRQRVIDISNHDIRRVASAFLSLSAGGNFY